MSAGESKGNARAIKEIEFRKKAVLNMWIIICTIFIADSYATIYSVTLAAWGDYDCYVQDTVWVKSLSTVTERIIHYILWLYPVIWLFWPKEARCRCSKRFSTTASDEITSSMVIEDSINAPLDDDQQMKD